MPIPTNKYELKEAITSNYENLMKELNGIPSNLLTIRNLPGHVQNTSISIKDILAYLTGWGQLVIKWHNKKKNNEQVDFPETGYK